MNKIKRFLAALAILAVVAVPAVAQSTKGTSAPILLAHTWNMNGLPAGGQAIVSVVNLTNVALTIAAQPDWPKKMTITVVDTTPTINAGTVTVVGTTWEDVAQTEAVSIAAGAGVYNTTGYFKTITSITVASAATLGGGGDETIKVDSGALYPFYACPYYYGPSGKAGPVTDAFTTRIKIKTASAALTTSLVPVVTSSAPFSNLAVGDIIIVTPNSGPELILKVTTYTSANAIAVHKSVNLYNGGAGYTFSYKKFALGYTINWAAWGTGAAAHQAYAPWSIKVNGAAKMQLQIISTHTVTGNLSWTLFCYQGDSPFATSVATANVTSAAYANIAVTDVTGYTDCHLGFAWTSDDASDTGAESITASAILQYIQ
jgi:hypothetical protein